MQLHCPVCQRTPLRPVVSHSRPLELDVCDSCNGLWFDGGELSAFFGTPELVGTFLRESEPTASTSDGWERDRKCPRCYLIMGVTRTNDVLLDVCQGCSGIWFDQGELKTVVERYRDGHTHGDRRVLNQLEVGFSQLEDNPFDDRLTETLRAVYWFFAAV